MVLPGRAGRHRAYQQQHGEVYLQPGKGDFLARDRVGRYFGALGISFRAYGVDKRESPVEADNNRPASQSSRAPI